MGSGAGHSVLRASDRRSRPASRHRSPGQPSFDASDALGCRPAASIVGLRRAPASQADVSTPRRPAHRSVQRGVRAVQAGDRRSPGATDPGPRARPIPGQPSRPTARAGRDRPTMSCAGHEAHRVTSTGARHEVRPVEASRFAWSTRPARADRSADEPSAIRRHDGARHRSAVSLRLCPDCSAMVVESDALAPHPRVTRSMATHTVGDLHIARHATTPRSRSRRLHPDAASAATRRQPCACTCRVATPVAGRRPSTTRRPTTNCPRAGGAARLP